MAEAIGTELLDVLAKLAHRSRALLEPPDAPAANHAGMVAFWLMPARGEAAFLDSLVAKLAAEHDAPVFKPHLTLYAGQMPAEGAVKVLNSIQLPQSYDLQVERVDSSEIFTKTLFVQFCAAPELQQLSDSLRAAVKGDRSYELKPHLSLLYKALPHEVKADLAKTIRIPFQHLRFDRLQVIAGNDHVSTRGDVESWRTLAARDLTLAPRHS